MLPLLLSLLAAAPASGHVPPSPPTVAAPLPAINLMPRLVHVYAGPDGRSHAEILRVAADAGPLPLTSMRAVAYAPAKVQWHNAPQAQFAINLSGTLEVETSDGLRHRIGPGELVFMSDTSGKGHVTRLLGPVTALFILPAPGFDVRAWARGRR